MSRPNDADYYEDRTVHVAQGDVFRNVRFFYEVPHTAGGTPTGRLPDEPISFVGPGILLNYTSGMMSQPPYRPPRPGTSGYRHHFRLVAPVLPLELLAVYGVPEEDVQTLRKGDPFAQYLFLPAIEGEFADSAACLYRPVSLHHDLLEGNRITQLRRDVVKRLQMKLAQAFIGKTWKTDSGVFTPDMSDHWGPPPATPA